MNGTAQIVEAIKNDRHGIGYVGVGYVQENKEQINQHFKVLAVKTSDQSPPYLPTLASNIENGNYPITRPLFQYTNGHPKGKLRQFLRYCLSAEGQALVQKSGYFPVTKAYWKQNEQALVMGQK